MEKEYLKKRGITISKKGSEKWTEHDFPETKSGTAEKETTLEIGFNWKHQWKFPAEKTTGANKRK